MLAEHLHERGEFTPRRSEIWHHGGKSLGPRLGKWAEERLVSQTIDLVQREDHLGVLELASADGFVVGRARAAGAPCGTRKLRDEEDHVSAFKA